MIIVENRASYILFNVLKGARRQGKWIIPSNCCGVIPAIFHKSGVPFETCDISPGDLCLDLQHVSDRIAQSPSEYAGVLYIYTYGAEIDVRHAIRGFKETHPSVILIEDKCLCRPELTEDEEAPADVTLFSTGYAKYVDIGMGGYAFIKDDLSYRHHGTAYDSGADANLDEAIKNAVRTREKLSPSAFSGNWLSGVGMGLQADGYFAEVGRNILDAKQKKAQLNGVYRSMMSADYCLPDTHSHWRFNILINEPEKLVREFFDRGLFASRHYCPIERYDSTVSGEPRVAGWLYDHVVNLFNDKYYSSEQAELTGDLVVKHVARFGFPETLR